MIPNSNKAIDFGQASIHRTQLQRLYLKNLQAQRSLQLLKKGIWAYFFLLIFEGALRKWFLPGLATPLLIIRDPLALWLVLMAWSNHKLRANPYLIGMVAIGILSLFTAVLLGHGSLPVAIFGARGLVIHFPLVFVIGSIFTADDVVKLGKAVLWITIPMTILIALQFYSPQSAWVNRGLAGDTAGAGFSGAMGYFRPPATFSFTNGTTLFYSLAACFIFYFWLNPNRINRLLLVGATVGLLAAIPLSISRGLFFQVGITVLFTVIAVSLKPKYAWRMVIAGTGLLITVALLNNISFFQTSTQAFTSRFETANEQAGGFKASVIDRVLDGVVEELTSSSDQPFFGYGLGMGTNVGAQLLTGGRTFLIAEGEWGRIIGELGPLLGLLVIFLRVSLTARITIASYTKLRSGNLLSWMLLSYGLSTISQGGWSQPTALGFTTLMGGLLIASLKVEQKS